MKKLKGIIMGELEKKHKIYRIEHLFTEYLN